LICLAIILFLGIVRLKYLWINKCILFVASVAISSGNNGLSLVIDIKNLKHGY